MSNIPIIGKSFPTVHLEEFEMRLLQATSDFLSKRGVGLHCAKCQGDFRGTNSELNDHFVVKCDCRELVGKNPAKV
tara:strand:- start:218 stop:445 length:228 start_codon:yes stop_codon:yes gene_type:complete